MITYVAIILAAVSSAAAGYMWVRLRSIESDISMLDETQRRHANAMRGYKEHIEKLYREIDMLASDGPQPEVPRPKPVARAELHNQRDLNDGLPLQGHTLIVGQSGSGKSNVLMAQIIRRLKAGQELHCIDTKDEIEPIFGRHVQCVPADMAVHKFEEMLKIARERRQLFAAASQIHRRPIRDFGEYFKATGIKLPVVTLICEELIVLTSEVDEDLLIKLLVTGRSAGVFVIALSQYLKADILSRKGTVNFNTGVFLGKYDSIAIGLLFGNVEKQDAQALREFLGAPGKGAVMEQGELTTKSFPQVTEDFLLPFFGGGDELETTDDAELEETAA